MLRRTVLALLILVAALGGGALAFAYLPYFDPYRQAAVERILELVLDRQIVVDGAVGLAPGAVTTLTLDDVRIAGSGADDWLDTARIGEALIGFELWPALRGRFRPVELAGDGIIIERSQTTDTSRSPFGTSAFVLALVDLLDARGTEDLTLQNVSIIETDDADGWNETFELDELTAIASGPAGLGRVVRAAGTFNDMQLRVDADFAAPRRDDSGRHRRAFTIDVETAALTHRSTGHLEADGSAIEADTRITIDSLGDQLEQLRLQRAFDGTFETTMRLRGPVGAVAAEDIEARARLSSGEQATARGRIGKLETGEDIALAITADLAAKDGSLPHPSAAFDLGIASVSGELTGALDALTLSNVVVDTDLAAADVDEIGPISVDRVVRDAEGRLGLLGIRVVSGDPRRPSLDLRGDVRNALEPAGIDLDGRFDLDVFALLRGEPAPPAIGRFAGTVAISDRSGTTRLTSFDGALAGDGPLALHLSRPAPAPDNPSPGTRIELAIADLAALNEVLGADSQSAGAVRFDGEIRIEQQLVLDGKAQLGDSPVEIDIRNDIVDGTSVFRGELESPALRLADLAQISGIQDIAAFWQRSATRSEEGGTPPAWLDAELDLAARIVSAEGDERSTVRAHLGYRDGAAALDPFELDYLGGTLQSTVTVELDKSPAPITLSGALANLQLARLLGDFGSRPLVTGPLDAELELATTGPDPEAMASSLSGTVNLEVGRGEVGTSLINLAGENIVSWLFSSRSQPELVCADGSITFEAGVGTIEQLVIETESVQIRGSGTLDLAADRVSIDFVPRPLRRRLVEVVTPFAVEGRLSAPSVSTPSTARLTGRAVAEVVTLPVNLLTALLPNGNRDREPCTVEGG